MRQIRVQLARHLTSSVHFVCAIVFIFFLISVRTKSKRDLKRWLKASADRIASAFAFLRHILQYYRCTKSKTSMIPGPPMFLIGHRGASASCPENTLAAFQSVFRKGFSGIELDVHRTKDNQIVCLHDDTLRRTASQPHRAPAGVLDTPVSDLEMDVIGQVAVGIHEGELQFPPRLADVLEIIPHDGVVLVELKVTDDTTIRLIEELVRHYKKSHAKPATIKFISFSAEGIAKMKKLMPSHQCYLLLVGLPMFSRGHLDRQARHAASLGLDGIDVNADTQLVDGEFVRRCGHLGLRVIVWRCLLQYENPMLWNAMRMAGVEAFTTDFPSNIMTWSRHENTNTS